jgi:CO/xanthine dehydrogenase Mo-binding subunit
MGACGTGEIGAIDVAVTISISISNDVCNTTGKRVRDFPITLDKFVA